MQFLFSSNISKPWFRIHVKCSIYTCKPFPFTGEARINRKIQSLELERQDDAVLNNIEGLNKGLFESCFDS